MRSDPLPRSGTKFLFTYFIIFNSCVFSSKFYNVCENVDMEREVETHNLTYSGVTIRGSGPAVVLT